MTEKTNDNTNSSSVCESQLQNYLGFKFGKWIFVFVCLHTCVEGIFNETDEQKNTFVLWWGYLQEAVPAAQEVSSLHDSICSEDQLVLTERRLIWTSVDRLCGGGGGGGE